LSLAPIALFVYNRPEHTKQTLEALRSNLIANQSDLFIFSDGSKLDEHREAVGEVRLLIRNVTGFKNVSLIERTDNLGLARSIIDGVTSLIDQYGKAIVVEDDIVTSPYFLSFMNEALTIYENVDKVKHISGYMFPVNLSDAVEDTFLLRMASCWGWATWRRAWADFEPDAKKLLNEIESRELVFNFDIQGSIAYRSMLGDQVAGKINSWAVRWYASIFLQNGLCLHPKYSLVNNIGHDGTGEHCNANDIYNVGLYNQYLPVKSLGSYIENNEVINAVIEFNLATKPRLYKKILNKLSKEIAQLKTYTLNK
jgi:hypothetical protein